MSEKFRDNWKRKKIMKSVSINFESCVFVSPYQERSFRSTLANGKEEFQKVFLNFFDFCKKIQKKSFINALTKAK